jgi:hypothetical protein
MSPGIQSLGRRSKLHLQMGALSYSPYILRRRLLTNELPGKGRILVISPVSEFFLKFFGITPTKRLASVSIHKRDRCKEE